MTDTPKLVPISEERAKYLLSVIEDLDLRCDHAEIEWAKEELLQSLVVKRSPDSAPKEPETCIIASFGSITMECKWCYKKWISAGGIMRDHDQMLWWTPCITEES